MKTHLSPSKLEAYTEKQFPPSSITSAVTLSSTELTTACPWKGTANYYTLSVDGQEAKDAAWYYKEPKTERAMSLKDHVAFCKYSGRRGNGRK